MGFAMIKKVNYTQISLFFEDGGGILCFEYRCNKNLIISCFRKFIIGNKLNSLHSKELSMCAIFIPFNSLKSLQNKNLSNI